MAGFLGALVDALADPSVWINGLLIGGVYAAVGLGFSMIWGIVGVINLSHGDLLMLGAFTTWTVVGALGGSAGGNFGAFLLGLAAAMVVVGALGYLLQRVLINRVMAVSDFLTLLLTFGIALAIQYSALLYWSATPRSIAVDLPGPPRFEVLGSVVPAQRLYIFLFAVALTAVFYAFLRWTRTGRAIRATGQNEQAAELVGIDVDHVHGVTFAVSAALVAAAGGLIGMSLSFQPQMGIAWTLKSFVVVVIGGLGSMVGALFGGLFLGVTEHVGAAAWGSSITDALAFTALVVFLLVKPHGLFGEEEAGE